MIQKRGDILELIIEKDRKKYYKTIENVFLFKDAERSFILDAVNDERSEWLRFKKGSELYCYHDFKNSLGIILKGRISVNKNRHDEGSVLINFLKSGDAFGGAAVFSKADEYIASLKAESDCAILFMPRELLCDLFEKSNAIMMNYIAYLSDSLVFLNKRLDLFTSGGAEERVAEYIRINSITDENGCSVLPDFSFSRLADYLAIGRASLYRILNDFEKQGLIKKEGKKIYIKGEK